MWTALLDGSTTRSSNSTSPSPSRYPLQTFPTGLPPMTRIPSIPPTRSNAYRPTRPCTPLPFHHPSRLIPCRLCCPTFPSASGPSQGQLPMTHVLNPPPQHAPAATNSSLTALSSGCPSPLNSALSHTLSNHTLSCSPPHPSSSNLSLSPRHHFVPQRYQGRSLCPIPALNSSATSPSRGLLTFLTL